MRVWLWLLLALLLFLSYRIVAPFLVPLAWAGVLAICFFPLHRRIRERLRWPNLAALATTLLVTAVIIVPAVWLTGSFAAEGIEALGSLRQEWQAGRLPAVEWVRQNLPVERIEAWLANFAKLDPQEIEELTMKQLERLAGYLAGKAGTLARNVLVFVLDLFVVVLATFYFFRDGPQAVARLRSVVPLDEVHRERLFRTAHDVLFASVYASFLIAILQGALGGLLFWILGIRSPVFWGVVMAFFSLLPLVGAWVVWLPAAVFLLLGGEVARGIILVVVGALVVGLVDNVMRPWLMSGRLQLNGLLVFVSILGGLVAFGAIGIIVGPMVLAIGLAVLDAYTATPAVAPPPHAVG